MTADLPKPPAGPPLGAVLGSAFAQWSPCIYRGAIRCADCDKLRESSPGADDECDMAAGRQKKEKAFEAGWRSGMANAAAIADSATVREDSHNTKAGVLVIVLSEPGSQNRS